MGIAKEIFGIEPKEIMEYPKGDVHFVIKHGEEIEQCRGFNQAVNAIDAFEISEEAIVCVIASKHSGNIEEAEEIAKAIKANAKKIFVRKS